jgi:hypothetical protein
MLFSPGLYLPMGKKPAVAGGSEATVLIDVSTSGILANSNNGVTSYIIAGGSTPNIGSGPNGTSNLCLLAAGMFGSQNGGTSTFGGGGNGLFWDTAGANQQFTQVPGAFIQNGASGGDTYLFYLMNPVQGSKAFSMNWTGANALSVAFASFVNVDQTGGTTSFPSVVTNSGTANPPSVTISTSPTTRKIIGAFSSPSNFSAPAGAANDIGRNIGMNVFAVAADWDLGSAASIGYSTGSSSAFVGLAAAIKGA